MPIVIGNINHASNINVLVSKVYPAVIKEIRNSNGKLQRYKEAVGAPLQLTIYSITADLSHVPIDDNEIPNTAVILPFPILKGRKNRFKIANLTRPDGVFEDMHHVFNEKIKNNTDDLLNIEQVDVFKPLVAPNIAALKQLSGVSIPAETIQLLSKFYGNNYGFIVCKISKSARYLPFAYIHELKHDGKLFIPTRQHHGQSLQTSYMTNSRLYRFHQPTYDDVETDESMVNNYLYDTMLASGSVADDQLIQYKAKKVEHMNHKNSYISRSHKIYVINNEKLLSSNLKNITGIKITYIGTKIIKNLGEYIYMGNFPTEITFNNIHQICRVRMDKKYIRNHDLFI